jgi:putative Flp pilus-assembly TadE/G-like protein
MDRQNRKCGSRSGQALIMVTLLIVPVCGIVGLVSDIGYMQFVKMSAQAAAESAAKAAIIQFHATVGGSNYTCGGNVVCATTPTACPATITTPASALENGCMYAIQNGFKSSGNQAVTYQSGTGSAPPTVPGAPTAAYWLTFRAVQRVPQLFSAVLGNSSGLVAARSTAAVIGASDCVYALNRTNYSGAVSAGGSSSLTSSCGIFVNSTSSDALSTNGGGTISAPQYDLVGGTQSTLTPTPNTGVSPASDPLSGLPVPASAPYTCDYYNYSAGGAQTLSPGVYCGGINVGSNRTYTLTTGTYILVGGGLSTQSANSTLIGNGVTIYNTFGATTNHGTLTYSPISLSGSSSVTLTAPNTGTYAGILIFEDRNAPANYDTYGGGSTAVYQGVIYALHAAVTMYGNSSTAQYTMLVADTISLVGNTSLNSNYSLLPNGSPIQQVVLME